MSDDITPEQLAAYQRRQEAANRAYITDAAKQIQSLAQQLGVQIVATPQLIPDGTGGWRIVTMVGVERLPSTDN